MIENVIKSLTKSIFAKVSAKYDADIASMKADIQALKNPVVVPTQLESGRPANIHYGIVSDVTGNFPAGIYEEHRYDFAFEFVANPGGTLEVLRHLNTITYQVSFSNLEVTGEGSLDIILVQKMYNPQDVEGDAPAYVNRTLFSTVTITKDVAEYSVGSNIIIPPLAPAQMYTMMNRHISTLNMQQMLNG